MNVLEFDNVSLTFPRQKKTVLKHLDFQLQKGETLVLLGTNGSGKSSLLRLIEQIYYPTRGTIALNGQPLSAYNDKQRAQQIKSLTQDTAQSVFMQLSIYENFLLLAPDMTAKACQTYLQQFNKKIAEHLDILACQLSGGERQSLALALAVYHAPTLLLLDEHTSALDPKSSFHMMSLTQKILHKHHISCILTTHDLNLAAAFGDSILILKNGEAEYIAAAEKSALSQADLLVRCY